MIRYVPRGQAAAIRTNAERQRKQREREAACALDFRVYGDTSKRGPHADRCVCVPRCAFEYDLFPASASEPFPESLYVGTELAALYDPEAPTRLQLYGAGWHVRGRE